MTHPAHTDQDASRTQLAAVPAPDSQPTPGKSKQLSPERREARAEFSMTIAIASATHGGATRIGRSLSISSDAVEQWGEQWGDPVHHAALTFGDAIAASRSGGREWARSIGVAFLAAVSEGAPVADVSPLRHAVWIGSAVGELQRLIGEALEDDELDRHEARSLLKEMAHADAVFQGFRRLLEQKARER